MKNEFVLVAFFTFFTLSLTAQDRSSTGGAASRADAYGVSWDEPGPGSSASMPLGNGDIGLNVWVDPGGDLLFYISKTDAWGGEKDPAADPWMQQGGDLMKLGLVRVRLSSNPLTSGGPFRRPCIPVRVRSISPKVRVHPKLTIAYG